MGMFEWIINYRNKRNYSKESNWIETIATFTGKREQAVKNTKSGFCYEEFYAYEIKYQTDEGEQRGLYRFYPLPDPELEDIQGETMKIRYKKNKPYIFEQVLDIEGADYE